MTQHLYEDRSGLKHDCILHNLHRGIDLVWTKCGMDVPGDKSFRTSYEGSTCLECIRLESPPPHERSER